MTQDPFVLSQSKDNQAPLTLRVEAVCVSTPGARVAKTPMPELMCGVLGFEGDKHAREVNTHAGKNQSPNPRQWSAVSDEEVAEVCAELGVDPFANGALGENLRLSGIALSRLPDGAVLAFPSGARLEVSGQNAPCQITADSLAQTAGAAAERDFVKTAMGKRGIVGRVITPGLVRQGDAVSVELPSALGSP